MGFFFRSCRNKKSARDKANARVSKRIARSKAPVSPKALAEPLLPVEHPSPELDTELSGSASQDTAESEHEEVVKPINLPDAPMTGEEDDRSAIVFAQDFVEEFTDMVSEDAAKMSVETENCCCSA
jgi:hypothetical protein